MADTKKNEAKFTKEKTPLLVPASGSAKGSSLFKVKGSKTQMDELKQEVAMVRKNFQVIIFLSHSLNAGRSFITKLVLFYEIHTSQYEDLLIVSVSITVTKTAVQSFKFAIFSQRKYFYLFLFFLLVSYLNFMSVLA